REQPELCSLCQCIGHEVHRPHLAGLVRTEARLALHRHLATLRALRAQLQLLLDVDSIRLVASELPAFALEQHMDASVSVSHARVRDLTHAAAQILPTVLDAAVVVGASRLLDEAAGPTSGDR